MIENERSAATLRHAGSIDDDVHAGEGIHDGTELQIALGGLALPEVRQMKIGARIELNVEAGFGAGTDHTQADGQRCIKNGGAAPSEIKADGLIESNTSARETDRGQAGAGLRSE